jgi:membrane protein YdbS with pleckstrin-like domain
MSTPRLSESLPLPAPTTAPKPAAQRLLSTDPSDLPDQEHDLAYIPFAGRSMLGGFMLCTVVTLAAGLAFWQFAWPLLDSSPRWLLWIGAGLLGAMWLVQLVRWAYRQSCYYVRLTTRRILYHRGVLYQWCLDVPLAQVARATVRRNPLERFLGVGNIELYRGEARTPFVTLTGIRAPETVAKLIRRHT